jgi:hypothetical protein
MGGLVAFHGTGVGGYVMEVRERERGGGGCVEGGTEGVEEVSFGGGGVDRESEAWRISTTIQPPRYDKVGSRQYDFKRVRL